MTERRMGDPMVTALQLHTLQDISEGAVVRASPAVDAKQEEWERKGSERGSPSSRIAYQPVQWALSNDLARLDESSTSHDEDGKVRTPLVITPAGTTYLREHRDEALVDAEAARREALFTLVRNHQEEMASLVQELRGTTGGASKPKDAGDRTWWGACRTIRDRYRAEYDELTESLLRSSTRAYLGLKADDEIFTRAWAATEGVSRRPEKAITLYRELRDRRRRDTFDELRGQALSVRAELEELTASIRDASLRRDVAAITLRLRHGWTDAAIRRAASMYTSWPPKLMEDYSQPGPAGQPVVKEEYASWYLDADTAQRTLVDQAQRTKMLREQHDNVRTRRDALVREMAEAGFSQIYVRRLLGMMDPSGKVRIQQLWPAELKAPPRRRR
jgi:hypothetical protein